MTVYVRKPLAFYYPKLFWLWQSIQLYALFFPAWIKMARWQLTGMSGEITTFCIRLATFPRSFSTGNTPRYTTFPQLYSADANHGTCSLDFGNNYYTVHYQYFIFYNCSRTIGEYIFGFFCRFLMLERVWWSPMSSQQRRSKQACCGDT